MLYENVIEGVKVSVNVEMSVEEIKKYIAYAKEKHHGRVLQTLNLEVSGDEVGIGCSLEPEHFEKIRRITGYLVGDMSRWNDGKTAEEHDRVKHG